MRFAGEINDARIGADTATNKANNTINTTLYLLLELLWASKLVLALCYITNI